MCHVFVKCKPKRGRIIYTFTYIRTMMTRFAMTNNIYGKKGQIVGDTHLFERVLQFKNKEEEEEDSIWVARRSECRKDVGLFDCNR